MRRTWRGTIDHEFHLSFRELVARSAKGCALYIEPPALARFGMSTCATRPGSSG